MSNSIPAIYENGVLRLLQPLPLREHEIVSLVVERTTTSDSNAGDARRQQDALQRMLDATAALPPAVQ